MQIQPSQLYFTYKTEQVWTQISALHYIISKFLNSSLLLKSSWPALVFALKHFKQLVEYFISLSQLWAQYRSGISASSKASNYHLLSPSEMFNRHKHQILQQKLPCIHCYLVKLFISLGTFSFHPGRAIQLQGSEQYHWQTLWAQLKWAKAEALPSGCNHLFWSPIYFSYRGVILNNWLQQDRSNFKQKFHQKKNQSSHI